VENQRALVNKACAFIAMCPDPGAFVCDAKHLLLLLLLCGSI
jgi:hypothetical protein